MTRHILHDVSFSTITLHVNMSYRRCVHVVQTPDSLLKPCLQDHNTGKLSWAI